MLKPLGDHIVIRPSAKKEEVSASGIILPTAERDGSEGGEVVAIGSGKLLDNGTRSAMEVKVGDQVVYEKDYNTKEVKVDGEVYFVVRADAVLAIIE